MTMSKHDHAQASAHSVEGVSNAQDLALAGRLGASAPPNLDRGDTVATTLI
jgi:hypothetical protein